MNTPRFYDRWRGRLHRLGPCLFLTACLVTVATAADDDDNADAARADTPILQVTLSEPAQAAAGITTTRLAGVQRRPERRALARVLALQPLLARRAELLEARAEVAAAAAQFEASDDAYRRLRRLAGGSANVSERELAGVRARQRVDRADLEAARTRLAGQRLALRHAWGPVIADWLVASEPPEPWQAILDGKQVLAALILPPGDHLASAEAPVFVAVDGARDDARAAAVISPAPADIVDAPGETWLLRLPGARLHAGMRLPAWIAQSFKARDGVLIPAAAIVWQDGRPWVYVQTGPERFARRPLPADGTDAGGRRFVTSGFAAGEAVVTGGAQLLLGEELRAQIPEEDDD